MNGFPDDRRRIIIIAAAAVGVVGLLFGGWLWWQARTQVSTDDAYVEGAVTVISAKVSGNIAEMLVSDNQAVKAGDLLVRVDPRDYRARRDQAAAAVAVAEAVLLTLRSELPMTRGVTAAQGEEARGALEGARAAEAGSQSAVEEAQAQLEAKRAAASAAESDVAGARATAVQAVKEKNRQQKLVAQGLVAQRDYDQAEAAEGSARAALEALVSKRTVELGQVAQMGQPLLAIVPLHEVWVIANFKETQLERIRPGMTAEVRVDTFSDRNFRGTVDSLAAGTGARFSLLPPENATGNWVKVVQRLPVKIRLDPGQFGNPHTLRAGMSAIVTVKLR